MEINGPYSKAMLNYQRVVKCHASPSQFQNPTIQGDASTYVCCFKTIVTICLYVLPESKQLIMVSLDSSIHQRENLINHGQYINISMPFYDNISMQMNSMSTFINHTLIIDVSITYYIMSIYKAIKPTATHWFPPVGCTAPAAS